MAQRREGCSSRVSGVTFCELQMVYMAHRSVGRAPSQNLAWGREEVRTGSVCTAALSCYLTTPFISIQ